MNVTVNIAGEAAAMKKLEHLGATWMEWKVALKETGESLKGYFAGQAFSSMGGEFGTPWPSLSAATQAYKSKHFRQYAASPLMRTGTMRESFAFTSSATHLEIINTADYFEYHQSTEPRKKIPRRPMFAINHTVKSIIQTAFRKAALAKIAGL